MVLSSSPPGAPRSIVSARSMPRPAYIAAHSPAGPAPTMITSYPLVTVSVIGLPFSITRAELEPRWIGVRRERPRELLLESYRLELDIRPLGAGCRVRDEIGRAHV